MRFYLKHIIFVAFIIGCFHSMAQTKEKLDLNAGVNAYKKGNYERAQEKFEKAYKENNQYNSALYNAANSAYRNGDFEKATEYYEQYAGTLQDKNEKAKAYHNLGNVYLKQNKLGESIEAYKNALRNNPNDEDTRYNLSYALSKLKRQQQQEKKDDKDKDKKDGDKKDDQKKDGDNQKESDKKEGDKSDKEKDGEKDKKDGEGDKKDQKKDEKGDKEQPKPGDKDKGEEKEIEGKMSKGQIEKDLDAVNEDEKNILLKIAKKKGKQKGNNNLKDW